MENSYVTSVWHDNNRETIAAAVDIKRVRCAADTVRSFDKPSSSFVQIVLCHWPCKHAARDYNTTRVRGSKHDDVCHLNF